MSDQLQIPEPVGGWQTPWPGVLEIAHVLDPERWALVGGLMVQAHALAAGVETNRVTVDVDAAVRVEAGVYTYAEAAGALTRIGYALDESTRLAYHFTRGADVVDLMVPDHERPAPRYARRDIMAVTGGAQAMSRLQTIRLGAEDAPSVVPIPTLHGALVLKAAAHIVDSRDRDRHLLDAITLLACVTSIAPILEELRGSDRKRLSHIVRAIEERPMVVAQAPADTLALAQRNADELRAALR